METAVDRLPVSHICSMIPPMKRRPLRHQYITQSQALSHSGSRRGDVVPGEPEQRRRHRVWVEMLLLTDFKLDQFLQRGKASWVCRPLLLYLLRDEIRKNILQTNSNKTLLNAEHSAGGVTCTLLSRSFLTGLMAVGLSLSAKRYVNLHQVEISNCVRVHSVHTHGICETTTQSLTKDEGDFCGGGDERLCVYTILQ